MKTKMTSPRSLQFVTPAYVPQKPTSMNAFLPNVISKEEAYDIAGGGSPTCIQVSPMNFFKSINEYKSKGYTMKLSDIKYKLEVVNGVPYTVVNLTMHKTVTTSGQSFDQALCLQVRNPIFSPC